MLFILAVVDLVDVYLMWAINHPYPTLFAQESAALGPHVNA